MRNFIKQRKKSNLKIRERNKVRTLTVRKQFHQIKVAQKVPRENMKTFKGNRKDTNLLNINFKTKICRVLEQMCLTKELTSEQIRCMNDFKESPPSFNSLINMIYDNKNLHSKKEAISIQNRQVKCLKSCNKGSEEGIRIKSPNIFLRLRKLFESSQIIKKIYENEGTFVNKLLMFKYIEAIRYNLIGNGQIVKWKQVKQVSVPK